jgi:hypothetical protein
LVFGILFSISFYCHAQSIENENAPEVVNIPYDLAIQNSFEISEILGKYQYKEPVSGVVHQAINYGIEISGTKVFEKDWFIRGVASYRNGPVDYSSDTSGTQSGQPTHYYEILATLGRDFSLIPEHFLSLYTGFGYRNLFNDARGTTSAGAYGYRRTQEYYYLPVGLMHRTYLNVFNTSGLLESNVEFDYLLQGNNSSQYSDYVYAVNGKYPITRADDLNFVQKSGYGLKFESMYNLNRWLFGPYFSYWNIQNSNNVEGKTIIQGNKSVGSFIEPANSTIEFGLKLRYRFGW